VLERWWYHAAHSTRRLLRTTVLPSLRAGRVVSSTTRVPTSTCTYLCVCVCVCVCVLWLPWSRLTDCLSVQLPSACKFLTPLYCCSPPPLPSSLLSSSSSSWSSSLRLVCVCVSSHVSCLVLSPVSGAAPVQLQAVRPSPAHAAHAVPGPAPVAEFQHPARRLPLRRLLAHAGRQRANVWLPRLQLGRLPLLLREPPAKHGTYSSAYTFLCTSTYAFIHACL
jgi:hypothetical protein